MDRGQQQTVLWLHQAAQRAARLWQPCPARFLPLAEQHLALHEARACGVSASFDGGWASAERVQVCFHPPEEPPRFDAQWLRIHWDSRFHQVEHRDLLGSLMGLGIDRAWTGDLLAAGDCAHLLALPALAVRLPQEWTQAGRVPIHVCTLDEPPELAAASGDSLRVTVASTRLDSVLAAALRLSRARAAELIRQGAVQVDHLPEERPDRMLAPGQLLSIRGQGRVLLRAVGAPTRKDRIPAELELFLHR